MRASSRVVCDSCGWSVPAAQCVLLSDSGQSRFKQEQFLCAGCLMTAATEISEVSKVPEVQESPVIEPPKGERVETTAVVQGAMAETSMYSRLEMR